MKNSINFDLREVIEHYGYRENTKSRVQFKPWICEQGI